MVRRRTRGLPDSSFPSLYALENPERYTEKAVVRGSTPRNMNTPYSALSRLAFAGVIAGSGPAIWTDVFRFMCSRVTIADSASGTIESAIAPRRSRYSRTRDALGTHIGGGGGSRTLMGSASAFSDGLTTGRRTIL